MPGIDSYSLDNYGLDGPVVDPEVFKRFATGEVIPSSSAIQFSHNYGARNSNHITVSGLGFRPNRIIVTPTDASASNYGMRQSIYNYDSRKSAPVANSGTSGQNYNLYEDFNQTVSSVNEGGYLYYCYWVYEVTGTLTTTNQAYINDGGFRLPVNWSTSVTWEAFRV